MRNFIHSEVVFTKDLSYINPPNWLSSLFKDVYVRNMLIIRLLICIRQYEIRVVEFDLLGLVIQLYGWIFGYMESLKLVCTLLSVFLILNFKWLAGFSHLMTQNLFLKNCSRTLILSFDFVHSQFYWVFTRSWSFNRVELHLAILLITGRICNLGQIDIFLKLKHSKIL